MPNIDLNLTADQETAIEQHFSSREEFLDMFHHHLIAILPAGGSTPQDNN
jgi:hypothetical protein